MRIDNKKQALKLLFHPEIYPSMIKREASEIKLTLWRDNSLGEYSSWSIFEVDKNYFVRRVIWKQRSAYHLDEPETYCGEIIISRDTFNRIMNILLSIGLEDIETTSPTTSVVIDGSEYGIIFANYKVEWRDQAPINLLELSKWHENTIIELEALFHCNI